MTTEIIKTDDLNESEQQEFMAKIFDLLKWQTRRYYGGDSTSIQTDKAQQLLDSLIYTLGVVCKSENITISELLQRDFPEEIIKGQKILIKKKSETQNKWKYVCVHSPILENYNYIKTIKNIGPFFKNYELYYHAAGIPCMISYPLISPVDEAVKGVSYIDEYLNRIIMENQFLEKYDLADVKTVLRVADIYYFDGLYNVCELVFVNALGNMMLNKDGILLNREDISELCDILYGKDFETVKKSLTVNAKQLFAELKFDNDYFNYYEKLIETLSRTIVVTKEKYNLKRVFIKTS